MSKIFCNFVALFVYTQNFKHKLYETNIIEESIVPCCGRDVFLGLSH